MFAPSSWNCTPTTPTSSDASTDTVTVPETVALFVGAVMTTVGALVSAGGESLSAMVTVALPDAPMVYAEFVERVRTTVSSPSTSVSSIGCTRRWVVYTPKGNVREFDNG